jgi:hypothetical protein
MIFALILFGCGPVVSFGYDPTIHARHRMKISFLYRGVARTLWVWRQEYLY